MAIAQSKGLIEQSTLRLLRAGQFSQKRPLGPIQTQAILESEREAELEREKAEKDRQAQIKIAQDRIEAEKERTQLFAQQARKERKAQETSFLQSVLGGT